RECGGRLRSAGDPSRREGIMSPRRFDATENADLRAKIDEAKRRLPLPELMSQLGFGEYAKKSARCLWHDDQHPSFSVFKGDDGFWHYKCFVCDSSGGDEIGFLVKHFNISRREAIRRYLDRAGFPPSPPSKSHEYPMSLTSRESPESPEFPEYPVSPVSNGQALEEELKGLAARNACTRAADKAGRNRLKFAGDVRALENTNGRELPPADQIGVSNECYRLSKPFLPEKETCDDHGAKFFAELTKVRVPTGEGETLNKALECVSTLCLFELPNISGIPDAPESWRRIAALHRELSRFSTNKYKTYFLSYRDAARAVLGLPHQKAYEITLALARLGVIKIVCVGVPRPNGGKASEFRYILPTAIEPFQTPHCATVGGG